MLAKGQCFTDGEYKQIMDLLNKDKQDVNQTNMIGIATCLFSHVEHKE